MFEAGQTFYSPPQNSAAGIFMWTTVLSKGVCVCVFKNVFINCSVKEPRFQMLSHTLLKAILAVSYVTCKIQYITFIFKLDIVSLFKFIVQCYCDMCVYTGEMYKTVLSCQYTASTVYRNLANVFLYIGIINVV